MKLDKTERDIAIIIPHYQNSFIYILTKDEEVVYVGQTKCGITRPFAHIDKEFDSINIIYCDEEQLDMLEDKYIMKYMPKYNKIVNSAMNYSLLRARNKLRKLFNNKMTVVDLKRMISELEIETITFNDICYIKENDYKKIVSYMEKMVKDDGSNKKK